MAKQGGGGIVVLAVSLLVGALVAQGSSFCRMMLWLLPGPRTPPMAVAVVAQDRRETEGLLCSTSPSPLRALVHAQAQGCMALEMKMGQGGTWRLERPVVLPQALPTPEGR